MVVVLAAGCGGSSAAPTQAPDDPVEPTLDFSAIAGEWVGWGVESFPDGGTRESWMALEIEESAPREEDVGSFRVGAEGASGQLVQDCSLDLIAREADPPDYRFRATGAGCTPALLDVEHDTGADILFVDVTGDGEAFTASHVLEPGSDPGPAPE